MRRETADIPPKGADDHVPRRYGLGVRNYDKASKSSRYRECVGCEGGTGLNYSDLY